MKMKLTLLLLAAGTLLTLLPEARGGTYFWTGGSTIGSYWSDAANWGNATPSTSDEWVFGSLARARSTNDYGSFTFFRTISIRTNGIYLTGQPLMVRYLNMDCSSGTSTMDMDLRPLDTSPGGLSISNPHGGTTLVLSGNVDAPDRNVDVQCGGTVTMSGAITGTNHMSEAGGGRLRFTGSQANAFAGEMNVQLGVLELNKTFFYLPLGRTIGVTSMPCDLRLGKWGSPYISAIAALYFHNQIADTADVTVNQTGQLDLNGYDDTIGALNMMGGSVTTGDGTLTLAGDLSASSVTNCRVAGNLDLGSPLTRYIGVTNPADLQLTANVSGSSIVTLRKIGNGELVLGGSNSYGGLTIIAEGQVTLTSDNGLGDAARGTTLRDGTRLCLDGVTVTDESLLVDDSAAMEVAADSVWFGPVQVNSNLVVSAPAGHRLTINGSVSGSGGFVTTNRGTFRLTGTTANSLSGTCRVDAGTVELAKVAGPAIAGTLIIGDGVGGLESDIVQHFMAGQFAPEARVVSGRQGCYR